VAVADVDGDGDNDFIVSSVIGNSIAWWQNNGLPDPRFARRPISGAQDGPRAIAVADINGDDAPDIISGSYRDGVISWYLNATGDSCVQFDVNGDGLIDSVELSWMGRAFGSAESPDGAEAAWWHQTDLSQDNQVDGLDLSILGSPTVWGQTVFTCSHTCPQGD